MAASSHKAVEGDLEVSPSGRPNKKRRTETSDVSTTEEMNLVVRAALTGELFPSIQIKATALGRDLEDLLTKQHRRNRNGVCKLLYKSKAIETSRSLVAQGITSASELNFVWKHISMEAQRTLVRQMHEGHGICAEDMDALNSLLVLEWRNRNTDNLILPSGLQSLTFGLQFNQRLDNATLPSSLQSLKFGWMFNQSLDNTTLPSGLQSLTFGIHFNQSLDNTTLPKGLQIFEFCT